MELPALFSWPSLAFSGFVLVMLVLDLTVFHRESKEVRFREAALWTAVWCSLALAFDALLWYLYGHEVAVLFFTGYLVEWSLSMDNVMVFAVIFNFFLVPRRYQYRVLFWGIMGAVLMRLLFIWAGAELIHSFSWIMLVFGVFLLYTAFKLAILGDAEPEPETNILMRIARKLFTMARGEHGDRFFVRENGVLCMTPLFLVLLVVESTDVLFAVDSVPSIFGITKEPFLVFTSNVFAILGLRALYFLLVGVMGMFHYLHYGLSAVLAFVALKMMTDYGVENHPAFRAAFETHLWSLGEGGQPISPLASLLVILALLGLSILASLLFRRGQGSAAAAGESPRPGASGAALGDETCVADDETTVERTSPNTAELP